MGHGGSGAGMESLVLGRWFLAPRQHNLATLRWDEKYEMASKWRAVPLLPCCNFTHCFTIRLWKVSRQIDLWSLRHLWWIFRLLGLSSLKRPKSNFWRFIWLCYLQTELVSVGYKLILNLILVTFKLNFHSRSNRSDRYELFACQCSCSMQEHWKSSGKLLSLLPRAQIVLGWFIYFTVLSITKQREVKVYESSFFYFTATLYTQINSYFYQPSYQIYMWFQSWLFARFYLSVRQSVKPKTQ